MIDRQHTIVITLVMTTFVINSILCLFGVIKTEALLFCESIFVLGIILYCRKTLRKSHQSLVKQEDLSENLPFLVFWTASADPVGVTHYNKEWEVYTGHPAPPPASLDYMLTGILHPDDLKILLPRWKTFLSDPAHQEQSWMSEVRIRRKDGQWRYHLCRCTPILHESGSKFWIGACTDIHDEKLAVERLALQDQRKDIFLATLAHELRNPLAPIMNALGVINKIQEAIDPRIGRMLKMIDRQVRQMGRLVEDLLDITRINRGKLRLALESHDLANDILGAVETVRPAIDQKHQHLKVTLHHEPLIIYGDQARLTQVFVNLLKNASKYTEGEGCIWVDLTADETWISIKIHDTGAGIAPQNLAGIFDLFSQEDRSQDKSQGGLGIGLALVKRIVYAHGGQVKAESEGEGLGTTITISLPRKLGGEANDSHATQADGVGLV